MGHPLWPLRDLVVRTPRLELRLPSDAELCELAALARRGLHTQGPYPFLQDWLVQDSPAYERSFYRFHLSCISGWSPEQWTYVPVALVDGEVVGTQDIATRRFRDSRVVHTGSWLGAEHQRRGLGVEMRHAILHLAFAGLGAEVAMSSARVGNEGSLGVSRRLGYVENGRDRILFGDGPDTEIRLRLDRADWEPQRRDDIEILGLEACLADVGLDPVEGGPDLGSGSGD